MTVIQRIVDNRVFLFGLDYLYRQAIKPHERDELLTCARNVTAALRVAPADVPIEGYYADDRQLTEYFRLMRGLAQEQISRSSEAEQLADFRRLQAVKSSPIYGGERDEDSESLLPARVDPLKKALLQENHFWSVEGVTHAAHSLAANSEDFSLAGLAALAKDPVVLCAMAESVVLYEDYRDVEAFYTGRTTEPPEYDYIWSVDDELSRGAKRFVETFNSLFNEQVSLPTEALARDIWLAAKENRAVGRCVNLGYYDGGEPTQYYHWAIFGNDNAIAEVQEFWSPRVWTSSDYKAVTAYRGPLSESQITMSDKEFRALGPKTELRTDAKTH